MAARRRGASWFSLFASSLTAAACTTNAPVQAADAVACAWGERDGMSMVAVSQPAPVDNVGVALVRRGDRWEYGARYLVGEFDGRVLFTRLDNTLVGTAMYQDTLQALYPAGAHFLSYGRSESDAGGYCYSVAGDDICRLTLGDGDGYYLALQTTRSGKRSLCVDPRAIDRTSSLIPYSHLQFKLKADFATFEFPRSESFVAGGPGWCVAVSEAVWRKLTDAAELESAGDAGEHIYSGAWMQTIDLVARRAVEVRSWYAAHQGELEPLFSIATSRHDIPTPIEPCVKGVIIYD